MWSQNLGLLMSLAAAVSLLGCEAPPSCDHVVDRSDSLIPRPAHVELRDGCFEFSGESGLISDAPAGYAAEIAAAAGVSVVVEDREAVGGDMVLQIDPTRTDLGDEGYDLVVDDGIQLVAGGVSGLFYGTRTLLQLLPGPGESTDGSVVLPALRIVDAPRFAWRGAMVDVARHYFGPEHLLPLIDQMAFYKLNRLHLHLTDDQGWRIDIESWPDLARVGGATEVGGGEGGWLSQAEYGELVAFAAARSIVVVPEIDMPGHVNAALASYGELNPDGLPAAPYTGTNVGFSSLEIGAPSTDRFVEEVLGEVAAMTPGPWLHIGGDEANETDTAEYTAFIQQVQGVVNGLGKTMIGWEEVGGAGVEGPFVAQYWNDVSEGVAAVEAGGTLISSPATNAYVDMMYDLDSPVGAFWAGFTDVEDGYSWDPVPEGVAEADVLGVEAALWTESPESWEEAEFLLFPRLLGHAEIGWTAEDDRDWDEYRGRLAAHGARLDAWGIAFYRSPLVDW